MPRLPRQVKRLPSKSRDAAMFAVDVYNKPATEFRSSNYIVMMLSAWTALLHALFEREKVKYFYRVEGTNNYLYVSGERQAWDLERCLAKYYGKKRSPIRQNIQFFIGLRNLIEQRFLPTLDLEIHGECQSLLLNYEKLVTEEFGHEYGLNTALAIPIQLLRGENGWREDILKETQRREYQAVKEYVESFRAGLDANIRNSQEFCFRVFLVPKIGESRGDMAVELVSYNPNKPAEVAKYQKLVAYIVEEKHVAVVNPGKLKPRDVAKRITETLGIRFHPAAHHARCWRYFKIRPELGSDHPEQTDARYCHYDAAHNDYVYTEAWVELLISELSDEAKRKELIGE